ncbi:MAG: hypothetical protein IPK50_07840 [Fibrobacterota bacterium]|nr:hypothetical protein [Fibrobacterota bacterium]QQS06802.1 MAG: hypothetical protein IPK50_07840 [Fibrobacterota bacterium]
MSSKIDLIMEEGMGIMGKNSFEKHLVFVFSWGAAKDGKVIEDPKWEAVEPILNQIHAEGFGFGGVSAEIMDMQEDRSYFTVSSLDVLGDEEYYLAMYTDVFEGDRFCISPHNPDPNDEGEVELGGNNWDKAILRKDFGFLRAIFKEYITHRKIPLELFLSKRNFD